MVTMQSSFKPQARHKTFWESSLWKTNRTTKNGVHINTVCDERIVDAVKVVTSKTMFIDSNLCYPAMESNETKLQKFLDKLLKKIVLFSLILIEIYDCELQSSRRFLAPPYLSWNSVSESDEWRVVVLRLTCLQHVLPQVLQSNGWDNAKVPYGWNATFNGWKNCVITWADHWTFHTIHAACSHS